MADLSTLRIFTPPPWQVDFHDGISFPPVQHPALQRDVGSEVYYTNALQLYLNLLLVVYESKDTLCLPICHAAWVVNPSLPEQKASKPGYDMI